ncbi:hypothetical protein JCM18237_13700 [Halorubrum luteum]
MFRRLRAVAPSLLVPLAWAFVIAAHRTVVTRHTLFMAHVVMALLLAGFAVTGRADMREGLLHVWWSIIAAGLIVTLFGAVGFHVDAAGTALLGVALGGWMLLPAVGFVSTGRRVERGAWVYFGGAGGCLVGVALYTVGVVTVAPTAQTVALVLVGVGQSAGILDAVLRY